MATPVLFLRISDAADLLAKEAGEPSVQTEHVREALKQSVKLLSPKQLRSLEEVDSIREMLGRAVVLAETQ